MFIQPTSGRHKGPWLLDQKALEKLDQTISKIWELMEVEYERLVNIELQEYLSDSGLSEKLKATADSRIRDRFIYSKSSKRISIIFKGDKKFIKHSLVDILKEQSIENYNPQALSIVLEKGPITFKLDVSKSSNGDLSYNIRADNYDFAQEVLYELNKWLKDNTPNQATRIWDKISPAFWLFVFFAVILLSFYISANADNQLYKNELKAKADSLITSGITNENVSQATTLLLQLNSDYIPPTFRNKNNFFRDYKWEVIFTILILVCLTFKPKTTIGIGKGEKIIINYRRWSYLVLIFIPLSIIIPYIINKIS